MPGGYLTNPDAVRLFDLLDRFLRRPATFILDANDQPVATFEPPLSAAEQTTYNDIVQLSRTLGALTPTDYAAVRAQMQILRDLRQMGRNAFTAQTQAQMNRQLYDATVAVTEIFLKLLRDS